MEAIYLLIGIILGGLIGWYITGIRAKQTSVPRIDFDALNDKLNQTVTELRVETEGRKSLSEQLAKSEASLRSKEELGLEYSRQIASLTAELGGSNQRTEEAQAQRDKSQTALDVQRTENERLNNELATTKAQLESKTKSLTSAEETITTLRTETKTKTDKITSLTAQVSELNAQKKAADEKLETQKGEIESIRKQSEAEFKNIATQILEEKSTKFTEMNKTNLETILKPLGDNIEGFRKKVEETYDKESKERFSLGEKVAELVALNQQISTDANNLSKALEGSSKTQGDWGELILERILEQSGLEKGREYVVQEFLRDEDGTIFKNEDGSKMQPDVVVSYPDDRKIIIDSKVSLVAYKRFSIADSKVDQDAALKEHVASIKRHIDGLSKKNYPDFTQSLDFVMMFVPIEHAFLIAMHHDNELWHYAYTRRVLLISPTNLIAALKMIVDLWKREYQNRHAIEIAETGGALYDKFVGFVDALGDIETHLGRAQKSHSNAMNLLRDGNGNLIRRVEKLKKLGAKAKKSLQSAMLTGADADYQTEEEPVGLPDEEARQVAGE
jgi:DNA recombination protein RmuC